MRTSAIESPAAYWLGSLAAVTALWLGETFWLPLGRLAGMVLGSREARDYPPTPEWLVWAETGIRP